jgi:hypothetical protein
MLADYLRMLNTLGSYVSRHLFLTSDQSEACYLGPKLRPRGGFL